MADSDEKPQTEQGKIPETRQQARFLNRVFQKHRHRFPIRIFEGDSSPKRQQSNGHARNRDRLCRRRTAIRERALKRVQAALKGKKPGVGDEKLYKGIHGYTDHKAGFRREHTVASEKARGFHGPLRVSAHIRTTARVDYQPDICTDYKETGYCGYGDSCKFMHDRGDYKSGWQLERDWDEAEKVRKRKSAMGESSDGDDDDDDKGLLFACFICRRSFVDPVVTKCKHFFCERCALKHHSKKKKCFVCNAPTFGIFDTAHQIRKRMATSTLHKI